MLSGSERLFMTSNRSVPFYSGAASVRRQWTELSGLIRQSAARGTFVSGPLAIELEERVKQYTGARNAIACGNGTDALSLMLQAAGVGPGDEVIVPAYTFFATASCVAHVGAEPVFVDVDPTSYAIDPEAVRSAIGPRTKAIMAVHLFHQMADIAVLRDIAEQHGLELFEDSAEAIGMRAAGRHAGLWGRAGVLSFFPTKTLGALGDAGMVLTDDDELAERVSRLRTAGGTTGHWPGSLTVGTHSVCDEIQAAVLLTRLNVLDQDINRRAELAAHYTRRLAALSPVVATPVMAQSKEPGAPVWYVYLIETDHRAELIRYLTDHQVGTEIYYPRPLTEQPCFRDLAGARHPVPVAKAAAKRAVGLPLYPDLTDEQVDRVCDLIHAFHGGAR
ncbi:DegT/DnrJ/EryC1/StrS family aminotransferase [Streptomyces sp. NPDC097595]|uniref:DegT/DnrJ/EryC1/StrS family aminotransferase n=1 Tax=Streptomyces sp. NPDC097595 TaxID=3366090 RepID=UPI0038129B47